MTKTAIVGVPATEHRTADRKEHSSDRLSSTQTRNTLIRPPRGACHRLHYVTHRAPADGPASRHGRRGQCPTETGSPDRAAPCRAGVTPPPAEIRAFSPGETTLTRHSPDSHSDSHSCERNPETSVRGAEPRALTTLANNGTEV